MSLDLQKVHFIAIGGAVMSNIAIELKSKGIEVTGSDDKIYDPSKSNLEAAGILPSSEGWSDANISSDLDAVILGMHAKEDNPELKKAQELGLKIYSFPEFIKEQSTHKQRIVIAGSHGKTTITGMIMHVLNYFNRSFDFLVGSKVKGIEKTFQLSNAPIIIIEGDEYFTSPTDPQPKFLNYDHHIALISGTSWDHMNVYPTEDDYLKQFQLLADQTPKAGTMIYNEEDKVAKKVCSKEEVDILKLPYKTPKYEVKDSIFYLKDDKKKYALKVFGKHNLQNMMGAKALLDRIGINESMFYEAIQSFEGTAKRGALVKENSTVSVYNDFAHAPSKLQATVGAIKELHPKRRLTACFELHTFSSLNKDFLPQYNGKFKKADEAIVYFNPSLVASKNLPAISPEDILSAFGRKDIKVMTSNQELKDLLEAKSWDNEDLLMMSSGTFDGLDIDSLADQILA